MVLDWLLPIAFAISMSANTPNTGDFSPDYLVQFEIEKNDTLYAGRYWERQLGQKYVGQEYWTAYTWFKYIYTKARYINVPSNALHFYQGDIRLKLGIFTFGYAYKYDFYLPIFERHRHRAVAGLNWAAKINDVMGFKIIAETTYDDAYTDNGLVFDYFVKTHLNFEINDTLKFFLAGDIVENNKVQNWATRLGISVELK